MIGVDTNVVIRMVTNDDPTQVAAVRTFLAQRSAGDPAFVSTVVLAETVWVLQSRLRYPAEKIVAALAKLMESQELRFQDAERLRELLDISPVPAPDLADYLVAWSSEAAGCTHTVTFDRRPAKAISSMELLS